MVTEYEMVDPFHRVLCLFSQSGKVEVDLEREQKSVLHVF